MASTNLFDLVSMTVSGTPGTSTTVNLGSAQTGFITFASAGAANGQTVVVEFVDVAGTAREISTFTYSSSGPSLTNRTLRWSTTGSLLNLTSGAIVYGSAGAEDITNKTGDTLTGALNWATAVTIASSTTPAIGAAASNYIIITGTTTITGFDTIAQGAMRIVRFNGALTLTYNATSLILPSSANITTAAGDVAFFMSEGSGNWRCVDYSPASGMAVVSPPGTTYSLLATLSLSGTSVSKTGITANDLLLVIDAETAGSVDPLTLGLSTNGGSSYEIANLNPNQGGLSATFFLTGLQAGYVFIVGNSTSLSSSSFATVTSATSGAVLVGQYIAGAAINAIQLGCTGIFTGGTLYILGR